MNIREMENERYSRQLKLQEIGFEGQQKILAARVLVVGAGGLGCPVLQYLAAAGVGVLGVMDFDTVSLSNLHRQILFTNTDVGKSKAKCAAEKLNLMNPHIDIISIDEKLTVLNIRKYFNDFDIIVDGTDNFSARYLINDGCVLSGKPFVYGSLFKFCGQVAVFNQLLPDGTRSPVYRDIFPDPPAPGEVPDCSDSGVLGSVAGITGTFQATEVIKLIVGAGNTLAGKLVLIDSLNLSFQIIQIPLANRVQENVPGNWNVMEQFDYENFSKKKSEIETIDFQTFDSLLAGNQPIQVIDVRDEWEQSDPLFINGILNIPLHSLDENMYRLNKAFPIITICASGKRSNIATKHLRRNGFDKAVSLEGGIEKWIAFQKA